MRQAESHSQIDLNRVATLIASAMAVLFLLCQMPPNAAADLPSYTEDPAPQAEPECEPDTPASLAIRDCSKLLGSNETDPRLRVRVYTMRGYAWLKEEEPIAAISDFTRAIELDATNISAIKGRARSYESLKKYDEALADWTNLIALRPKDTGVHRERGYLYQLAGQHELAIKDFTQALELDKNSMASLVGRAVSLESLERFDEALTDFETVIRTNSKFIPAYVARGEFWERRGNTQKAIADYQKALELNSINLKVRQALKRLGVFWVYP